MTDALDELRAILPAREGEHLECKEAKNSFEFEDLVAYCAALANEGGGRMVLGVTNRLPRRVVGTRAFGDIERTKTGLLQRLHIRIDADEIQHSDGRVLMFRVSPRPLGMPLATGAPIG